MYATDVRRRQTDVRRTSSLNAPYPSGGGIIISTGHRLQRTLANPLCLPGKLIPQHTQIRANFSTKAPVHTGRFVGRQVGATKIIADTPGRQIDVNWFSLFYESSSSKVVYVDQLPTDVFVSADRNFCRFDLSGCFCRLRNRPVLTVHNPESPGSDSFRYCIAAVYVGRVLDGKYNRTHI